MDSSTEMIIQYSRSGGHKPPQDREILDIRKDGIFSLWRSIGSAAYPPTPVGRFAGQLPSDDLAQINLEVANCIQAGNLIIPPLPDAALETVQLPGVQANLFIHAEPSGAWGILVTRLREYLKVLTRYPLSAVSIEVSSNGTVARLSHLGSNPIRIDFAELTVRAVLWKGYKKVGDWFAPKGNLQQSPARITAIKGWSLDLPFHHGFNVQEGREVVAYITFTIYDEDTPVHISLESPRANLSE
jgi:hypothetical protein